MRLLTTAALLLACGISMAAIKTEDVAYKHGGTELQGFLAYDDAAQGKRPGILIVHEWWGLNDYPKERAKQLAQLGYVVFAADIFGKGKITEDPKQAGEWAGQYKGNRQLLRDRANAGLDLLKKNDRVDAAKIAAIGYCFGGTTVLELARGGAEVAGIVSFHGSLDAAPGFEAKQVKAKVLVLHGADDPAVPDAQVAAFQKEMRTANADWTFVSYGGAKHGFTNPKNGTGNLGGVAAYQESADTRSWIAMKDFFNELFGTGSAK